uniref:Uncharacterized protein n=1 Tax=Zea mays TaxID=4577 RepID=C4J815_MAIZE|nr:unknown [Zea mays]
MRTPMSSSSTYLPMSSASFSFSFAGCSADG